MRSFLRWTILLIVIAAIIVAIALAMKPQPIPVDLAAAARGSFLIEVAEEGQTRIRERYIVSSPLTGRLRRIDLEPGDPVEAQTTVLAVLEPTDPELLDARALAEAEARVRAAEAAVRQSAVELERARAAYDFAENDATRVRNAATTGAASPQELDAAETRARTAMEEFRAAEIGQEITSYELEVARSALLYAQGETDNDDRARMELTSPIDGAVLRVFQESVAVITPGTPLLEVGDPRDLEIVIDVLSTDAVSIEPGQRVIIDHWGGDSTLEAVVRRVEPSAFTRTSALGIEEQRVNVIIDFVSPPEQRTTLGDGFRIEGSIITDEANDVLHIPNSAVFRSGSNWAAFVIKDNTAHETIIQLGRQNNTTVEVLNGLNEHDQVILHPADRIKDNTKITPRTQ